MNLRRGKVFFYCVAVFAASASACWQGKKWDLVPVEGIVSRAGCPLAGVQVVFWTDAEAGTQGPRASGLTDAEGRYELRTDAGDRGAAMGRYRVCVLAPPSPDERLLQRLVPSKEEQEKLRKEWKEGKIPTRDLVELPRNYGNFQKTPLRAEVHAGGRQTFDFDVPDVPLRRKRNRDK